MITQFQPSTGIDVAENLDPITEPIRMPLFSPPQSEDEFPVEDESLQLTRHQVPRYQEFPVECFPEPVQQFITAQARTLNCDPAVVAVPVLAVLASTVGTQRIRIKQAWTEPAILWTALIANGQTCHDAALSAATTPLRQRQSHALKRQQQLLPGYEQQLARYRAEVRRAKRDPEMEEPVRPVEPSAERTVAADWTVPSLARLLTQQGRGPLVCSNELDGWLGRSLGNGCRASLDRQVWHDLHAGRGVTIETRSSRPAIQIEQSSVSLTGSLSEELLTDKLTKISGPCGLASRLLFAFPAAKPQQWTDADVDDAVADAYASVVERMFGLCPTKGSDSSVGHERSDVRLSPQAKSCFIDFMDDLSQAQMALDDVLFAWSSNLAGQAARLALVLHLARWGSGESVNPQICDLASMERGIALARWFAYEAQRVVISLSLQAELRDELKLIDWLRRRHGRATPRDLCRSNSRKYPTLESAVNAFNKLVGTGITNWVPKDSGPKGGRPTRQVVTSPTGEPIDPQLWQEFQEHRQTRMEEIKAGIQALAAAHPEMIYPKTMAEALGGTPETLDPMDGGFVGRDLDSDGQMQE